MTQDIHSTGDAERPRRTAGGGVAFLSVTLLLVWLTGNCLIRSKREDCKQQPNEQTTNGIIHDGKSYQVDADFFCANNLARPSDSNLLACVVALVALHSCDNESGRNQVFFPSPI